MNRISYLILFLLLSVSATAQVTVTTEANEACSGETVWFKASGAYQLFIWSDTNNLDTIVGDSVNFTATAGTYNITVLGYSVFPLDTDTVSFTYTVNALPSVNINSSANAANNFICLGDTATLTADDLGFDAYAWSPGLMTTDSTAAETMVFPSMTQTFSLMVTDSNGCSATATRQVKVNATIPGISIESPTNTLCPGQSVNLTGVSNFSTSTTFEWAADASLNTNTGANVVATPTTTTTYTVTGTYNACTKSASKTITVLEAPTMSVTESSNGSSVCLDETVTIETTCALCDYYVYHFPNSTLQTTATTQTVSPNNVGAVNITITGYAENGCFDGDVVTINVDDCYVGTPFSVEELTADDVTITRNGGIISVAAPVALSQVRIYSILGEEVANASGIDAQQVNVNASELASGLYVIMVQTESAEITKKLYLK